MLHACTRQPTAAVARVHARPSRARRGSAPTQHPPSFQEEFRVSFVFLSLGLLGTALVPFLTFHTYLVTANYTTIEFLEKRGCNPPPDHVNRWAARSKAGAAGYGLRRARSAGASVPHTNSRGHDAESGRSHAAGTTPASAATSRPCSGATHSSGCCRYAGSTRAMGYRSS